MRLRLHGTAAECATATERLRRIPGLHSTDASRLSPDRADELVRVDLTVDLGPTSGGQPGLPTGGGGGSR